MTVISDIYDALHTRVVALLPDHTRLSNPYFLEQNNALDLRQGYGIAVRSGFNTNRQVGCQLSVERTFDIRITRKYYAREFDAVAKSETYKDILEDLQLVIDEFEKYPTLAADYNPVIKYISDTGINNIFIEKDNFNEITATYTVEYFKNL